MARITLHRKPLFTLVELKYESNGHIRYACTTMDREVKTTDPRVKEFKRRILQQPKKVKNDTQK